MFNSVKKTTICTPLVWVHTCFANDLYRAIVFFHVWYQGCVLTWYWFIYCGGNKQKSSTQFFFACLWLESSLIVGYVSFLYLYIYFLFWHFFLLVEYVPSHSIQVATQQPVIERTLRLHGSADTQNIGEQNVVPVTGSTSFTRKMAPVIFLSESNSAWCITSCNSYWVW